MKKRSEVLKKRSAAERTIPLFEETELFPKSKKSSSDNRGSSTPSKLETKVMCEACDEESDVEDFTKRSDGDYECPHCGAPTDIDKASQPKKESTSSPRHVEKMEKHLEDAAKKSEPKKERGVNTSSSGIFCAECGTQWPLINGEKWPNCGHKNEGVSDPSLAKRIRPPAGHQMPTVKRIRVTYHEAMYRVADFSTFRTPTIELEAEIKDGENYLEIQKQIYAEAKRMADEAYNEIYEAYMQKLGFMREDLSNRK